MKKTRFTETQIVSTLKKQEAGIPVKEICRELGISEPAFTIGRVNMVAWKPPM